MLWISVMPIIMLTIQFCFIAVLFIYLLSNIDDLIIDLMFFGRLLYRRFVIFKKHKHMAIETLYSIPEKPIAVMFPAWKEAGVINSSLRNLITTIDYANFHVFVGTYPNDLDTGQEVEKLKKSFPHVHHIITANAGPTCKADCLNSIIKGIDNYEKENGMQFNAVVMQDAEDIVHPLSLRLFNYLIPRFDLIQIPVISLEREWHNLTGGHYMDEFAEFHSKEILVREMFAGVVPGAGVGTAYSRTAVDFAKSLNNGEAFNTSTLTEDYEFSIRLREAGLKQIFAQVPVTRTVMKKHWLTGKEQLSTIVDYICTREFFPSHFWAAVRQKTRWTVGISLQGWRNFGWKGNWRIKYLFMRDRKMVILSHAMPLGLTVVVAYIMVVIYSSAFPESYQPAPLLAPDSKLWYVVIINQCLVIYRLIHRHYWTHKYYGWHALPMVLPRYFWAIVINYLAVVRAIKVFLSFLLTGKPIGWDKTAHEYPDEKHLALYKRRLGDLLIEKGYANQAQLQAALDIQKRDGGTVGAALISLGVVKEEQILQIVGLQTRIAVKNVDPYSVPFAIVKTVPPYIAKGFQVFPVGYDKGNLLLATTKIPQNEEIVAIEKELKQKVSFCLALSNDIVFAIKKMYCLADVPRNENEKETTNQKIGQKLLDNNSITKEQLDVALKEQRKLYKPLGSILVEQKIIHLNELENMVKDAAKENAPLGNFLMKKGKINEMQLNNALEESQKSQICIGKILVKMGAISSQELEKNICKTCEDL